MASSSPLPSSSPRAMRTRAALIAAGFDLLVDRPIDAIPIDDVVTKAGVAKGSFFNHFADKQAFATAIATEVRLELEALVTRRNAAVIDPVERIAGGMRAAAEFALAQPKRTAVLLRGQMAATETAHPLNTGLRADIEAARQTGVLRPEAEDGGLLYWLGLCQILMVALVERAPSRTQAEDILRQMLVLGLTGFGINADRAAQLAATQLPA